MGRDDLLGDNYKQENFQFVISAPLFTKKTRSLESTWRDGCTTQPCRDRTDTVLWALD